MALTKHALRLLAPHIKGEVLSLGYPDLLASGEDIKNIFGYFPTHFTDRGEWHGADRLPETFHVFASMRNANLTCIDIVRDQGSEFIRDLNEPTYGLGQYDLVIDAGTIEHCFNIGQAIMNAANAVKVGGRIFHSPPMTMLNHGFYNICPTLLHDFYSQNGWTLEVLQAVTSNDIRCEATQRFTASPEYSLNCIALRNTDQPLKFPVQTKYLNKIKTKAADDYMARHPS